VEDLFDDETLITNLFDMLNCINDDKLQIILDAFTNLSKVLLFFFEKDINSF